MRRDVFQAIADPTRREIIRLIAQKPLPLNSIAENFAVSRPAISKHIRILTECGIVMIHTRGRERYCEAQLQKLTEVSQWVDYFKTYWTQKLDALGEFLDTQAAQPRKTAATAQARKTAATAQARKTAATAQPRKTAAVATAPTRKTANKPNKKKNKTYGKSTSHH
ncbi:MAG TPA: metalloregulator ArsR/SmtB family transcription factor [Puia sp.]|jgi:DNA-binding transcriptional ArsR family regulator